MSEPLRLITLIRKLPTVSTEEFRHFMELEYGPTYTRMTQVQSYRQHYVVDQYNDGSEDPIDAVVEITFDSAEAMAQALDTEAYRRAHRARENFMRPTTVGIHSVRVERTVTPS